jgi:7-cyano-7-deazaguanine synthase in queuosine biosynthesis
MFSGGLDSTAALYKLLTETADELRVLAWCREHCRPFRYSESALDFSALNAIPIDYICVGFVACQVAIDTPGCNRIAVGTLAADLDEIRRKVTESQRRVFDAMYACYRAKKLGEPDLEWIYPVYHMDKAAVAASLPAELRSRAWSCRRPVHTGAGYRVCGECKPCRKRTEVSAQLGVPL